MTDKMETKEVVSKMVHGLVASGGEKFALDFMEMFMTDIITDNVTDPMKLNMLRIMMMSVGIDHLMDAKELRV